MKTGIIGIGALALLLITCSCNNNGADSKGAAEQENQQKIDSSKSRDTSAATSNEMAAIKQDADFAVNAADGGMLEVQLGKLAGQNGPADNIKKLGAMMVADHSAANIELQTIAKNKNISLPATMSEKCLRKVQELSIKKGTEFDKAYADLMVSDHQDDIEEFKTESEKGKDSTIMVWAKNKVPILQQHLIMAEQAKQSLVKSNK